VSYMNLKKTGAKKLTDIIIKSFYLKTNNKNNLMFVINNKNFNTCLF